MQAGIESLYDGGVQWLDKSSGQQAESPRSVQLAFFATLSPNTQTLRDRGPRRSYHLIRVLLVGAKQQLLLHFSCPAHLREHFAWQAEESLKSLELR